MAPQLRVLQALLLLLLLIAACSAPAAPLEASDDEGETQAAWSRGRRMQWGSPPPTPPPPPPPPPGTPTPPPPTPEVNASAVCEQTGASSNVYNLQCARSPFTAVMIR